MLATSFPVIFVAMWMQRLAPNVTKLQKADSVDLARYDKRFIKLAGRLERRIRKGAYIELLLLENGVEVVVRQKYQDRLPSWQFGDQILVEGFVQKYRDKWQVQLFRGVSPR